MIDVSAELLELKNQALAATKAADGDFYRGYLHDDAIAITPYGVFDKEASFASDAIDNRHCRQKAGSRWPPEGVSGRAGRTTAVRQVPAAHAPNGRGCPSSWAPGRSRCD